MCNVFYRILSSIYFEDFRQDMPLLDKNNLQVLHTIEK